jgi:hypothetical protein
MPLFMDVHNKLPEGAGTEDVASAHEADPSTESDTSTTGWMCQTERSSAWLTRPTLLQRTSATAKRTVWSPTRSTRSGRASRPDTHQEGGSINVPEATQNRLGSVAP